MVGKIRTKDRCKKCGNKFAETPVGFICLKDLIKPDHYYIEIHWKGTQYKIYHDVHGDRLDSWDRASDLYIEINKALKEHVFDPSNFVRREAQEFWVSTILGDFQDRKLTKIAPSYKKDYRRMVNVASEFFKEKDIRDLRPVDLEDYQERLSQDLSSKSVKNYLDHFKTFLRWCMDKKGIISKIPAFPEQQKYQSPPHWLEHSDQQNLFLKVPEDHKPIIAFLMLHGCRPGEARAIKLKDIDLKRETITISRTWSAREIREIRKGPRGSAQPYTVPINEELLPWIAERCRQALPEAFLFINPRTGDFYTENALKRAWDEPREAAKLGKELRLYDATRHSFATNLSNSGTDIKKLRDMMGHSDIRTTMKYAHSNVEHLRADFKKLSLHKVIELKPDQTRPAAQKAK